MHSEGLRLRKIVTDRWVHVFPSLVSCGIGRVKESMGKLELQCFFRGDCSWEVHMWKKEVTID